MKKLKTLLVLSVIASCASKKEMGPEKKKFVQYQKQFFSLENYKFDKITCNIDVPTLSNQIKQIQNSLGSKGISIEETITTAQLFYVKGKGLSVSQPRVEVNMAKGVKVQDKERFEQGKKQIQQGLLMAYSGMVQGVDAIFKNIGYEDLDAIEFESVKLGKIDKVKYTTQNIVSTIEKKGNLVNYTGVGQGIDLKGIVNYKPMGKKLVYINQTSQGKMGPNNIDLNINVKYQKLEKMIFPKKITTSTKISGNNLNQNSKIVVNIKNCKLI